MKKLTFYLGSLFLTVVFCSSSFKSYSQDTKFTRQEQKEARKAGLFANYQAIDTLLQRKTFVIEANYLKNQYGDQIPVTSLLNYIKVNSTDVVLQTGSNSSLGSNGVGGITAEGEINNYVVNKDLKHMNYTVKFSVNTNIGNYDVLIRISANNSANATISGLSPGKLIWDGNIVAIYNSRVFKGQNSL